ncbi:MAG: hypothetical protein LBH24_06190 [Clostridiales bacterium]|jgi:hypothetical protein|nr:hypothetical protein [Clostridiales bacterium]
MKMLLLAANVAGGAADFFGSSAELFYFVLAVVFGVLALGFIIGFIVLVAKLSKARKRLKGDEVDDVKIVDGVRYTRDADALKNGGVKVSHVKGDVVLTRGVTYTAAKDGKLLPGKYTVLSADENSGAFNIRLGGLVRSFPHFSAIVLNEGDEITPVSHTVILR